MVFLLLGCSGFWDAFRDAEGQTQTSLCEDYCGDMMSQCGQVYSTDQRCLDECLDWDVNGMEGDRSGDTVQCRQHALSLDLCEEAGPDSTLCSPEGEHTGRLPDDTAVQ